MLTFTQAVRQASQLAENYAGSDRKPTIYQTYHDGSATGGYNIRFELDPPTPVVRDGEYEFHLVRLMRPIRLTYSNGRVSETEINGTEAEIRQYYLGQWFNFGDTDSHPADDMQKVVSVEFLD